MSKKAPSNKNRGLLVLVTSLPESNQLQTKMAENFHLRIPTEQWRRSPASGESSPVEWSDFSSNQNWISSITAANVERRLINTEDSEAADQGLKVLMEESGSAPRADGREEVPMAGVPEHHEPHVHFREEDQAGGSDAPLEEPVVVLKIDDKDTTPPANQDSIHADDTTSEAAVNDEEEDSGSESSVTTSSSSDEDDSGLESADPGDESSVSSVTGSTLSDESASVSESDTDEVASGSESGADENDMVERQEQDALEAEEVAEDDEEEEADVEAAEEIHIHNPSSSLGDELADAEEEEEVVTEEHGADEGDDADKAHETHEVDKEPEASEETDANDAPDVDIEIEANEDDVDNGHNAQEAKVEESHETRAPLSAALDPVTTDDAAQEQPVDEISSSREQPAVTPIVPTPVPPIVEDTFDETTVHATTLVEEGHTTAPLPAVTTGHDTTEKNATEEEIAAVEEQHPTAPVPATPDPIPTGATPEEQTAVGTTPVEEHTTAPVSTAPVPIVTDDLAVKERASTEEQQPSVPVSSVPVPITFVNVTEKATADEIISLQERSAAAGDDGDDAQSVTTDGSSSSPQSPLPPLESHHIPTITESTQTKPDTSRATSPPLSDANDDEDEDSILPIPVRKTLRKRSLTISTSPLPPEVQHEVEAYRPTTSSSSSSPTRSRLQALEAALLSPLQRLGLTHHHEEHTERGRAVGNKPPEHSLSTVEQLIHYFSSLSSTGEFFEGAYKGEGEEGGEEDGKENAASGDDDSVVNWDAEVQPQEDQPHSVASAPPEAELAADAAVAEPREVDSAHPRSLQTGDHVTPDGTEPSAEREVTMGNAEPAEPLAESEMTASNAEPAPLEDAALPPLVDVVDALPTPPEAAASPLEVEGTVDAQAATEAGIEDTVAETICPAVPSQQSEAVPAQTDTTAEPIFPAIDSGAEADRDVAPPSTQSTIPDPVVTALLPKNLHSAPLQPTTPCECVHHLRVQHATLRASIAHAKKEIAAGIARAKALIAAQPEIPSAAEFSQTTYTSFASSQITCISAAVTARDSARCMRELEIQKDLKDVRDRKSRLRSREPATEFWM
ncbi:hypothetical protein DFJ77DRAFT_458502, partial [Powellomyces hirtus]